MPGVRRFHYKIIFTPSPDRTGIPPELARDTGREAYCPFSLSPCRRCSVVIRVWAGWWA